MKTSQVVLGGWLVCLVALGCDVASTTRGDDTASGKDTVADTATPVDTTGPLDTVLDDTTPSADTTVGDALSDADYVDWASGCSGYEVINPEGKLHGVRCESDDECKYGICYKSPVITGGDWGICTKDCSCGIGSDCILDDTEDVTYKCFRPGFENEEDEDAFCLPVCYSPDECAAFDSAYNACEIPNNWGVVTHCIVK